MKKFLLSSQRNSFTVNPHVILALEEGFKKLQKSDTPTPLKEHLSPHVFNQLLNKITPLGSTLLDVIGEGLTNHSAPVGVVIPDQYAYETFQALLDPILDKRHFGFAPNQVHPPVYWGDWSDFSSLGPSHNLVQWVLVSVGRNLNGIRFPPTLSEEILVKVEEKIMLALHTLGGEYSGRYQSLHHMSKVFKKKLEATFPWLQLHDVFCQPRGHECLGRGVFVNNDYNFLVLVNAIDHVRIISQDTNGNLRKAYRRLAGVMPYLDSQIQVAYHSRIGILTVNPDLVGSGLSIVAHLRLLDVPPSILKSICKVYHLQIVKVETDNDVEDIYMATGRSRLGSSENDVVREFNNGLRRLFCMLRMKAQSLPEDEDNFKEIRPNVPFRKPQRAR